jgi:hypothetical protein
LPVFFCFLTTTPFHNLLIQKLLTLSEQSAYKQQNKKQIRVIMKTWYTGKIKDAELLGKRCGAFEQKMRSFWVKDAELLSKRCGAFG